MCNCVHFKQKTKKTLVRKEPGLADGEPAYATSEQRYLKEWALNTNKVTYQNALLYNSYTW